MKLCSQSAGTFPSRMNDEVMDHGSICINCCSVHLHHYPDGPTALLNFILEMTFFTIRMVIWIDGPSSCGSSDRCSGSHSNSTLRSLIVFKSRLANWILVILKAHPLIFYDFPSNIHGQGYKIICISNHHIKLLCI